MPHYLDGGTSWKAGMIDFNDRMHDGDMDPRDAVALYAPQQRGAPDAGDEPKAQAERILKRNRQLVEGEAQGSHEGEREVGVGRSVNSDTSHHGGDYSSD